VGLSPFSLIGRVLEIQDSSRQASKQQGGSATSAVH
jgi:hypothetical protein